MNLLRENDLIFGNLLTIDEPHMVARYNKALEGFGLAASKLKHFDVDMTGYSPQIAEELDNPLYLDPAGINRRFIILTPDQAELPVVHTLFSNTEDLMLEFFTSNTRALYALTIKDVVFGEIEDSVFKIEDIEDLLAIEMVEFKISTSTDILGKAGRLKNKVNRLLKEPDSWRDDALLKQMVALAKDTGDIRTNTLLPEETIFRHDTFWTAHFGGVYVFNDEQMTTVIGDPEAPGFRRSRPWQVSYLDINNRRDVYRFLSETGRIDPPRGAWIEDTGLLERRATMAAIWMAKELEPELDFARTDRRWVTNWVAHNPGLVEDEGTIPLITWVLAQTSNWSGIDMQEIHPNHRFALCRAAPEHRDNFLVNRLISEYLPFDYMTRYIYNKPAFYSEYSNWPDTFKEFVVGEVKRLYLTNRAGYRERNYH